MESSARLAHQITWRSSKQSYLTAVLLADRDRVDDCLRAYAYFRWADDRVDVAAKNESERVDFIRRQQNLVLDFYRGIRPAGLAAEETMLADLISHDRSAQSGLRSFIDHFMTVIAFDAHRQGRRVGRKELSAYTHCLAVAVMDGLQYFIGNRHRYLKTPDRVSAVIGAHLTHMLRDLREDISAGIINIPMESQWGEAQFESESHESRAWVRGQVIMARACFKAGRRYIESIEEWRCQLAGLWYCQRFENILGIIEMDEYRLRRSYSGMNRGRIGLQLIWTGCKVFGRHVLQLIPASVKNAAETWKKNHPASGATAQENMAATTLNRSVMG